MAACGGEEPNAHPRSPSDTPPTDVPPTEEPEAAATEAPGSYVDTLEHTADPSLVNITWHWVRRDPNGNQIDEIVVPNPENYTLLFNEDGTFNAQVDCNSMNGRYATTPPDRIFMEAGAMTMAMCPEDSFSNDMLQMFGPAQITVLKKTATPWSSPGPLAAR
ncbi:MAG: META domain-containing protein [Anaerolineae bacterium]|nr:META domain-containing protein [Anaerolineae bacterium]